MRGGMQQRRVADAVAAELGDGMVLRIAAAVAGLAGARAQKARRIGDTDAGLDRGLRGQGRQGQQNGNQNTLHGRTSIIVIPAA